MATFGFGSSSSSGGFGASTGVGFGGFGAAPASTAAAPAFGAPAAAPAFGASAAASSSAPAFGAASAPAFGAPAAASAATGGFGGFGAGTAVSDSPRHSSLEECTSWLSVPPHRYLSSLFPSLLLSTSLFPLLLPPPHSHSFSLIYVLVRQSAHQSASPSVPLRPSLYSSHHT